MGYEDGLYCAKNIIGYTGEIDDSPTVYFLEQVDARTQRFGHITQAHWLWLNTGREKVHSASNYTYVNKNLHGTKRLVEEAEGFYHESRHEFIPTGPGHIKEELEKSIARFQQMKSIFEPQYYSLVQKYLFGARTEDDFDKALRQAWGGEKYKGDVAKVWGSAFIAPRRR